MKSFVGITGTTCVGKSDVAVQLAKLLQCQIISADSMQVYKGMDVGTAKISPAEMQGIKHHMLDVAEPCEDFSAFQYGEEVAKILARLERPPIVVGGTGFYFDSLLYPPEFGAGDKLRRKQLQDILQRDGLAALQDILRNLDAKSFAAIDVQNPVRVIRAIEIAESGASRAKGGGRGAPKYDCKLFVLQRSRESLYKKIDERVDKMIADGLVREVSGLVEKYGYCDTSAFSAIGYKEIIEYLRGNCTLNEAVEQIKVNTRHYAKRQTTYFKKMDVAAWIDVEGRSCEQIAAEIFNLVVN